MLRALDQIAPVSAQERAHHQLQVTAELSGRLDEVRALADANDLAWLCDWRDRRGNTTGLWYWTRR